MRTALALPAAALGSRARCSPPGAVSAGLRVPAGWGDAFVGGAEGCGGRASEPRGPSLRGSHGKGSGVGPGRASLPEGLLGYRARRAHLRLPEPWCLAPPGKIAAPEAWGAEVLPERLKEGRTWLDLGTRRSLSRLPDLASQTPLHKPAIPSSCFWVRPARGNSGRCLFGSGTASRPGGCCGPGREDESAAVEQVVPETE